MSMKNNEMFAVFYDMGSITSKWTKFGSIRLLVWVENASGIMLSLLVFFTLQTTQIMCKFLGHVYKWQFLC